MACDNMTYLTAPVIDRPGLENAAAPTECWQPSDDQVCAMSAFPEGTRSCLPKTGPAWHGYKIAAAKCSLLAALQGCAVAMRSCQGRHNAYLLAYMVEWLRHPPAADIVPVPRCLIGCVQVLKNLVLPIRCHSLLKSASL